MAKLTETLVRSSIYSMCKYAVSWLLKVGLGSALSVTCNFIGNSLSQESHRATRALFTKTTEKFWKEAWGWRCESQDRMNQSMKRDGNVSEFALTSTHTLSGVILLRLITLWKWFHSPAAFAVCISTLICKYHRISGRFAVLVLSSQKRAKMDQSQK